ncbi:uncharacterized protein HD556DRAFT_1302979 [Suillus plorans]|uniref:Secreted protein n=1 Tax=Suillus plorans TaxID=116603 RepID=A0A9P7DZ62_9AGAM|nr:uncharacterized protein HD556DRAFT_1302979 [Suillus plorans]KAG1806537.1 hypothetical protein HD556DRAFT_1302979 [Suillus plorans]
MHYNWMTSHYLSCFLELASFFLLAADGNACLVGLRRLEFAVTERLDGGELQFRTFGLGKLVIQSLVPLILDREIVEGCVVQCKSLELRFWEPETALLVGRHPTQVG